MDQADPTEFDEAFPDDFTEDELISMYGQFLDDTTGKMNAFLSKLGKNPLSRDDVDKSITWEKTTNGSEHPWTMTLAFHLPDGMVLYPADINGKASFRESILQTSTSQLMSKRLSGESLMPFIKAAVENADEFPQIMDTTARNIRDVEPGGARFSAGAMMPQARNSAREDVASGLTSPEQAKKILQGYYKTLRSTFADGLEPTFADFLAGIKAKKINAKKAGEEPAIDYDPTFFSEPPTKEEIA